MIAWLIGAGVAAAVAAFALVRWWLRDDREWTEHRRGDR